MSGAATLEVQGLSRRFGKFALEQVNLRLQKGEYWVLLGPSGCGKSMLLQTVSGFFAPEAGFVRIDGRDATGEPPEARGIGLVFQQSALFPHFTVEGNIGYGLEARRVPAAERKARVAELVERLGLSRLVDRPVATLSGGEAQKVAIARALAIRPAFLLLDEPLSLVDHNARLELQTELKRWHAEFGLTTLHVTHSRDEARAMGDHCAVMLGGRLVQCGPTDELFSRPRCPFVASFLGLRPEDAVTAPPCSADCVANPSRCTGP
jgi:ABC-type sugar transport system ATPase subunit